MPWKKVEMLGSVTATVLIGLFLLRSIAHAEDISFTWFTIDGGGGSMTNGQYTLNVTFGQPDAGTLVLNDSSYKMDLEGGFWGGVLNPEPPRGPTLKIVITSDEAFVEWKS